MYLVSRLGYSFSIEVKDKLKEENEKYYDISV